MFYVCELRDITLYHRLSWGLLYAVLVTIMSILMSIIATCTALFPNSDFFVIFTLIFLYGISSVSTTGLLPKQQLSTLRLVVLQALLPEGHNQATRNISMVFFDPIPSCSTDLFLLHADAIV